MVWRFGRMPDVLLIEESSGTRIMGRREYSILSAIWHTPNVVSLCESTYPTHFIWDSRVLISSFRKISPEVWHTVSTWTELYRYVVVWYSYVSACHTWRQGWTPTGGRRRSYVHFPNSGILILPPFDTELTFEQFSNQFLSLIYLRCQSFKPWTLHRCQTRDWYLVLVLEYCRTRPILLLSEIDIYRDQLPRDPGPMQCFMFHWSSRHRPLIGHLDNRI